MRTHYDVLGVPPSASADEVKRAYHRRAREHHPDVHVGGERRPDGGGERGLGRARRSRAAARRTTASSERPRPIRRDDGRRPPELRRRSPASVARSSPTPSRGPTRPRDALVLVPVALLAIAVACFAFSTMTEAPVLLLTSVILLAMAGLSFVATPLLVLRRSRQAPRRDGADGDPPS